MSWFSVFLTAVFGAATVNMGSQAPDCSHLPPPTGPAAAVNDNRVPGGTMRNGILEMNLVLQRATWYPEGEQGCGVNVFAFAEEGKTAQTPGPLIRVRVGAALRVVVRNALPTAIVVRGLLDRPADTAVARKGAAIPAGESRTFEFRAATPGTYLYFATPTTNVTGFVPANDYSQAVGALVVDPPENPGRDRIFVFTRWRGPQNSVARTQGYELMAFNGRSWPHTERITATVGDTVRWRVISANNDGHAMHLHGFHFVIESEGDLARDSIYSRDQQRHLVTQLMGPNNTMKLRWIPAREGNWIFHCHLMRHMSASQRLDRMPGATPQAQHAEHTGHAMNEMAGLVLGITVAPAKSMAATQAGSSMRSLRVFANQRERVFGDAPAHSFVVQDGDRPPAADSIRIPGSPIVLTRGALTQITVTNRLSHPLAVHWHGIELESFFDGVAGWSGAPGRIAPPIAPRDSFVVRMAPPRAGTFIYHVHNDHGQELQSGLYGPLIVLEPGARFDPETNRVFMITEAGPGPAPLSAAGAERPPFINGSATPSPIELVVGRTYRLRFIVISASDIYAISLRDSTGVVQWRQLAQDGADLPAAFRVMDRASAAGGPGETADFEFRPSTAGVMTLSADPFNASIGAPSNKPTTLTINVRRP